MRKITTALVVCSMLLVGCTEEKISNDKNKPQQQQSNNEETSQKKLEMSTFQSNIEAQIISSGIKFRMAVVNSNKEEAAFDFSSEQQFDVVVRNGDGEKVYQYSDGQTFSQQKTNVVLGPNKANVWEHEWLVDTSILTKGEYTVQSSIPVTQINGTMLSSNDVSELNATTTFMIEHKEMTPTKVPVVEGTAGVYKVTGTVSTNKEVYYSVEDGHNLLVDETAIELKKGVGNVKSFEININIPKENLPINGVLTLEMYSKDVDGTYTPLHTIVLEQIKQ